MYYLHLCLYDLRCILSDEVVEQKQNDLFIICHTLSVHYDKLNAQDFQVTNFDAKKII